MSQNDSTPPVVCTLTEEQAERRPEEVETVLRATYEGVEEQEDGYTFRFEGTDEALSAVAEFVSNELQCCSFADYHIAVSPPFDETRLTVTGPEGTKNLFGEGFLDRLEGGPGEPSPSA